MTAKKSIFIDEGVKRIVEYSKHIFKFKDIGRAVEQMLKESPKFKKTKELLNEMIKKEKEADLLSDAKIQEETLKEEGIFDEE